MVLRPAPVIPPFRFTAVEDGVMRSAYPTEENFRFLKRLQLTSVLSLTPQPPRDDLKAFCTEHGIESIHYPIEKPKNAKVTFKPADIAAILAIVLDVRKHPILVHCLDGANVTGVLVMCLRRVQNWAQIAVEAEFHRFTKDREVASSESDFIIAFRHRIALPEHTPLWLSAEETRGHPLILSNTPADGDQTHADTNKRPYDAGHPNAEQTPYTNKHRVHAGDEISLAVRALALDGLADYLRR